MRKIELCRSELSAHAQIAQEMAANCFEIRYANAEIGRGYEKLGINADNKVSSKAEQRARKATLLSLRIIVKHSKRLLKLAPPQASVLLAFECARLASLACKTCMKQQTIPLKCGVTEILLRMIDA